MLNLPLNELKLIAKSRGITGYKIMSEDAFNASKSVKESENNFASIKWIRNEDYDADEILKKQPCLIQKNK